MDSLNNNRVRVDVIASFLIPIPAYIKTYFPNIDRIGKYGAKLCYGEGISKFGLIPFFVQVVRSEERRVGKECL